MTVSIITVGDELLVGRVVDTHAAFLSAQLSALGVSVCAHRSVGDRSGELENAILEESRRASALVVAGGMGPTEDDRTREEIAVACGCPLEFREEWWAKIEQRMKRVGVQVSNRNKRQAFFPHGAHGLENRFGSAPGFQLESDGVLIWALPGVPHEFRGMIEEVVLPEIERRFQPALSPQRVWTFHGIPESTLDAWIVETLEKAQHPFNHHICVRGGEIEVRLPSDIDLGVSAREHFGSRCLGEGDETVAERVVKEATEAGLQVALAESCTGGRIAGRLTDVPGSSRVFASGWVTYANDRKEKELGVAPDLMRSHGAVSGPVVEAMARGAWKKSGATFALSTSGIAGPSGGSATKPGGPNWFGFASEKGVSSGHRCFQGDRERVRMLTVTQSLVCILAAIRGEDPFPWSEPRM